MAKKIFPIFCFCITLFVIGCTEKDISDNNTNTKVTVFSTIKSPVVRTNTVSEIFTDSAKGGGELLSNGGDTSTVSGLCWSEYKQPTTGSSKVQAIHKVGSFTCSLTQLRPNKTYYYRAFARNVVGTVYGSEYSFTTKPIEFGIVADFEGNQYKTIALGKQVWMAQNLRVSKYKDHTDIPTSNADITPTTPGKYQWLADTNAMPSLVNIEKYGRLYTWRVVNDENICPDNWHLPTSADFDTLEAFLADSNATGSYLKDELAWPNSKVLILYCNGFNAIPAGFRYYNGIFDEFNRSAWFWTADKNITINGACRLFNSESNKLLRNEVNKNRGLSVRCVKNQP
jgi:uncharacterized protein (TIGR02145 family)